MSDRTEQVDDLHLVAMPSAVGCMEMFVTFSLTEWALRDMRELAGQVGRELAAAVVAAADQAAPGMITARIRVSGDELVIELESPQPVPVPASPPGGRAGAGEVGPGRYIVWCTLPLPVGMTAANVPLPRRQRKPSQAAAEAVPEEPMSTDSDVMARILFGLNSTQERRR
ncbi:MAG: ATP-binding protein [Actinomycetota bacterium]|nr:ATP-binding protein [Actinomycetota bacterium]